jgi:hypothetical protein
MGRKKRAGRIIVAVTTAVAAGGLGVVAAPAGAQPQSVVLNCSAKEYRILFWSNGHGAIPSVGFPEFPVPHVELYVGKGKAYPDSQLVGFTDSAGNESHSQVCTTGTTAPNLGAIRSAKGGRESAAATCKLSKKVIVEIVPGVGTSTLRLFQSGKPVADATVGRVAAVRYNKNFCKASKLPS